MLWLVDSQIPINFVGVMEKKNQKSKKKKKKNLPFVLPPSLPFSTQIK